MAFSLRLSRGKFYFLVLMLCLGGAGAAVALKGAEMKAWLFDESRDAGMVLEYIDIQGNKNTPRRDIENKLEIEEGMPLISLDLEGLRKRVEELPWVQSVTLKRAYPNRLQVIIQERRPVALWQSKGQLALIDETGRVLTRKNLTVYQDYLLLVGETAHKYVKEITWILESQSALRPYVQSAVRVGDRRWDIHFKNGMTVRLPESAKEEALEAYDRFVQLEKKHGLLAREIAVIDMRGDKVILQLTREGQKQMQLDDFK